MLPRRFALWLAPFVLVLSLANAARAQESNEDRLREAYKKITADFRALQDSQAQLRAQLEQMTQARDAALAEVAQLKAAPQPAAGPSADEVQQAMDKLKAQVDALKRENTGLQAALTKWQAAYQQAAQLAQERDAEAKKLTVSVRDAVKTLDACKESDAKLAALAREILHLYETQDFRALLWKSYEPILGMKRVELENMIQDYDDRIYKARFYMGTPASVAGATQAAAPAKQ